MSGPEFDDTTSPRSSPLSPDAMADILTSALHAASTEQSGAEIGPYKLLQKLGEGGFGVVWMAEQQAPIRRRVALKIIKLGMDTHEVIARFEAERQALALMDHPNIARVFDAGATESGRPYFVMELVRGVAITRYCDENCLSAEARLRLFVSVCQAVQHAHQKGVIHRDLKPSNILITLHDGTPTPKVIDFGIAKATSAHLTDKTLFTQFKAFIGTPAYTSPEQMEMSGLDVDTRSDIYSLGVLLYELLTGSPPFNQDELAKSGLDAMRRIIREIDPPRPSIKLGTLAANDRTIVAHQRGVDLAKLSYLLRGDLDWIVMRCLEKNRTRRYETASGLALDIQRHLNREPVLACPPSTLYRLQKFFLRHKAGVLASTALILALVTGLVISSSLFLRERTALGRAEKAEKMQRELREQAEDAHTAEIKRAAQTSLDLAEKNLSAGAVADGLAYLVYAARKIPSNTVLASRLASLLTSYNFALADGPPIECGSRIVAIRFSRDGTTVLVGTEDGAVRIFDSSSGKILREFRVGKPVLWTNGWLFARDSDEIAVAQFQDNSLGIFEVATGRQRGSTIPLETLLLPEQRIIQLSADGRWLITCEIWKFSLWDTRTGELRLEQPLSRRAEQGGIDFDFSPDGQRLSVVNGGNIQIISLPDCQQLIEPLTVEHAQTTGTWLVARFFSDSRRLAICDAYEGVRIFDPTIGNSPGPLVVAALDGFGRNGWTVLPDGRLMRAGSTIYDLNTKQSVSLPLEPGERYQGEPSLGNNGALLLTASSDNLVRLWDTRTGKIAATPSLQLPASAAALSPNGEQIFLGTNQGTLHRLHVGRGPAQPWIIKRPSPALPLMFLPGSPTRLLLLDGNCGRVLDVASGKELAGKYAFPKKLVHDAPLEGRGLSTLRPDGRFLLVHENNDWESWELGENGSIKTVPLQDSASSGNAAVVFSEKNDFVTILALPWHRVRAWDLHNGHPLGPPIEIKHPITWLGVNYSADGRQLALAALGAPAIWDPATGRPIAEPFKMFQNSWLVAAEFSPDLTSLLTIERKGEIQLRDAFTGEPRGPVLFHPDPILSSGSTIFSPDGRFFTTRSSSKVKIWNTATTSLVGEPISLHSVRDVRFSPDSRTLVATSAGSAQVYDVRSAQALTGPLDHKSLRVPTGYLNFDGSFLRTETSAGEICIWSIPPRVPDDMSIPAWLLELATLCAGKEINQQGQLTSLGDTWTRLAALRTQIASLPGDAPLAAWARWVLNDREDRPLAPGFNMTPAEAKKRAAELIGNVPPEP